MVPTKILPVASTATQAMEVSQPTVNQYAALYAAVERSPVM